MPRPATVSPERILAVAALEFAARGYAGARVDRIARRARVNKAMLYYHFGSKQALYRAILRQIFSRAADRLREVSDSDAPPAHKIERIIAVMAGFIAEHECFPAIMLREVAEGGAHLDRDTLKALASVPLAVGAIVQQGVAGKTLRRVHPVAAYFTMFAPIIMYLAGAPIRKELTTRHLADMSSLTPDLFVRQLQESVRLAFAAPHTRPFRRRTSHAAPRAPRAARGRL
jgi:TetR/AcrR family transcriptional regulator